MSRISAVDFGTKGLLRPGLASRAFSLTRLEPSPDLAPFIAWYWIVRWELRGGAPYRSATVPFPSVNVTIEGARSRVHGVVRRRFTRTLRGHGRVFGLRFRPGMFQPFFGSPVHRLTGRVVSVRSVFGAGGYNLGASIAQDSDVAKGVALAESFLRERLPIDCSRAKATRDLVERVADDRTIVRASQIAAIAGWGLRDLERAFRTYVGVTPKWVIQRYRLLEAAERLGAAEVTTLSGLAAELGYFDQAHFSKAFKALIGVGPMTYLKRSRPAVRQRPRSG